MKKNKLLFAVLPILCSSLTGCGSEKTISVCASDIPHAEILQSSVVQNALKEKGYKLEVTILDWTLQNDAVATKDYDANYFQHVPYLETYSGNVELFASCKIHYEPLGIYSSTKTTLSTGSFAICNDVSNAIRAMELLKDKGIIDDAALSSFYKVENDETKFNFQGANWTSGNVSVTLVAENLLVSSMSDYDFACLPCNTAYTGKVDSSKRVAVEDKASQVTAKANIIAARKNDYNNDADYKAKIDALTDVMLSKQVRDFILDKYLGAIICNDMSQIDLRK